MFVIQLNSGVPIYRQVFDQVVREIDCGRLKKDELLPSVRQLATELGVNPMTISRAYSLLESEGIVQRKRGVGMLVAKKAEKPADFLRLPIKQIVVDAKKLGLTQTQLIQMIRKSWK
jgi:GntR family transcriptional regulator